MDKFITVITPTYNRATNLRSLYRSLLSQTNNNFIWLIVDDGSTDDTNNVVSAYVAEKKIQIKYIKKENGGKHTALNLGIKTINTPLTFIVDSDDELTDDAIEVIRLYYEKYKETDLCGFSFLRKFPDGKINGNLFNPDEKIDTYINCRVNGNDMNSDKAEVYFTSCLKEFPFPEFEGERFLGEDVVWARMSRKYQMVHINRPIYISEYLETGLTRNRRKNNIKSPNGCMTRANEYLRSDVNLKFREKCALQYLIYGWFAKKKAKELLKSANQKWLVILNLAPAKLVYKKWKTEFEENN